MAGCGRIPAALTPGTEKGQRRRLTGDFKRKWGSIARLRSSIHSITKLSWIHGLTEKEHDHVFIGTFEGVPKLNPEEAAAYRWISLDNLEKELTQEPEKYTYWFREIIKEYLRRNKKLPK